MKTALITLHATRPRYSKLVLDAMDHQCQGLHHIVGIEDIAGYKEDIYALIESKMPLYASTTCVFNSGVHHTNNNLRGVLAGLVHSDFDSFIYLEDDTLPSKGAVEYLRREYMKHVGKKGFSHVSLSPKQDGRPVTKANLSKSEQNTTWIGTWGFMGPISLAHALLYTTPPYTQGMDEGNVWDQSYTKFFLKEGLYAVQPYIARMQNIGEEGGLHRGGHTWQTWEGL